MDYRMEQINIIMLTIGYQLTAYSVMVSFVSAVLSTSLM